MAEFPAFISHDTAHPIHLLISAHCHIVTACSITIYDVGLDFVKKNTNYALGYVDHCGSRH